MPLKYVNEHFETVLQPDSHDIQGRMNEKIDHWPFTIHTQEKTIVCPWDELWCQHFIKWIWMHSTATYQERIQVNWRGLRLSLHFLYHFFKYKVPRYDPYSLALTIAYLFCLRRRGCLIDGFGDACWEETISSTSTAHSIADDGSV